jgi:hypothetical protein
LNAFGKPITGAQQFLLQAGCREGGIERLTRIKAHRRDPGWPTGRSLPNEIDDIFAKAGQLARAIGVLAKPGRLERRVADVAPLPNKDLCA